MEIGHKIKNARVNAGLTQEQAAEALLVSRQTISNWENEKTYPDILSVVKISDLYNVSLDYLLKEEQPMTEYVTYLAESTDTVKSKDRLMKTVLLASYLVIWAIAMLFFWAFMDPADAMGYALIFNYFLLPVATLVISFLMGRWHLWWNEKWVVALCFGLAYMLAAYGTFSLANMLSFHVFRWPDLYLILVGGLFSVIGIFAGHLLRKKPKKESCS